MEKAIILTKDNCPNCQNLKMFLKMAMRDQYKDNLREVHQSLQADEFVQLTKQHNIMSTPALIYQQDIVRGFEPQSVVNFLIKYFGKK